MHPPAPILGTIETSLDQILTLSIFLMGLGTVIVSTYVAFVFFKEQGGGRRSGGLATALGDQLIGEAVMGAGTLIFAGGAYFGWLQNWSVLEQSSIRFTMFAVAIYTTLRLHFTIRRIKALGKSPDRFTIEEFLNYLKKRKTLKEAIEQVDTLSSDRRAG